MGRLIRPLRSRTRDGALQGARLRRSGMSSRPGWGGFLMTGLGLILYAAACAPKPAVTLSRDDAAGRLTVLVGGREALVLQYGPDLDLAHYWPMRSPSEIGK